MSVRVYVHHCHPACSGNNRYSPVQVTRNNVKPPSLPLDATHTTFPTTRCQTHRCCRRHCCCRLPYYSMPHTSLLPPPLLLLLLLFYCFLYSVHLLAGYYYFHLCRKLNRLKSYHPWPQHVACTKHLALPTTRCQA